MTDKKSKKSKVKGDNVVLDKDHHANVDDIKTNPSTSNSATSSPMPILHNTSVSTPGTYGADETVNVGPTPGRVDSINVAANRAPATVSVAAEKNKKHKKED